MTTGTQRVAIFIDGPNLYKSVEALFGKGRGQIDILGLVELLGRGRPLVYCSYWTAPLNQRHDPQKYAAQQRFFRYLEQVPEIVVGLGHMRRYGGIWKEKGVDVGLAIDLLMYAGSDQYDVGILVSGDGDLARAVWVAVQVFNKGVEVVGVEGRVSWHLRKEASRYRTLRKQHLQPLLIKQNPPSRG
jgi:uncharacterized LabA/DUF88 family protein